jgi:hypothetical protein
MLGLEKRTFAVSESESTPDAERFAIEADAARFLRDFASRSARAGKLGCAWFAFFVFVGLCQRSTSGVVGWLFMSAILFFALAAYLQAQARRTRADFQRAFPSRAGDAHAREIAVRHLHSIADTKGTALNAPVRKLLRTLGADVAPAARAKPLVREAASEGRAPPPIAMNVLPARDAPSPPRAAARAASPSIAEPPAPDVRATLRSSPTPPTPTSPAPTVSRTPTRAEPVSHVVPSAHEATSRGTPVAPKLDTHATASSLESAPESAANIARATPATTSISLGDLVEWRCDSCGTRERVSRAEANRLCPTCFPQIKLDA